MLRVLEVRRLGAALRSCLLRALRAAAKAAGR